MLEKLVKDESFQERFKKIVELQKFLEEETKDLNNGIAYVSIRREYTDLEKNAIIENIKIHKFGIICELRDLQESCEEKNCYSVLSKFESFANLYDIKLNNFLDRFTDSLEEDYINNQLKIYKKLPAQLYFLKNEIKYTCKRKIEFLKQKQDDLLKALDNSKKNPLSNFKVVFLLEDLGVLKFLSNRPMTQEKIAHLIGLINGRHPKNIKDFIATVPKRDKVEQLGHKQKLEIQSIIKTIDNL